ncbi:WXG100 family type VII secretion target [Streptomyces sp. NPDC091259]|uniref:WXG100 family type VII secretion target n=1 Tax=Streptomyces sp. NPDC091259 TaxID=3365976 RepID=UPI0037FE6C6C
MGDEGKILDIKTADLKAAAPTFHDQSVALGTALGTLRTSLAKAGAAWGDDDPGKKFHDKYGPILARIEESAGIIKDGLASIHAAMTDMADGHIENDALVGAMFRKVASAPHGGPADRSHQP